MKRNLVIMLALVIGSCMVNNARENTIRKNLKVERTSETAIVDSIKVDENIVFNAGAVVMRGYTKTAGASKESFMLTNNTNLHISQVEIAFRYTDVNGELLHERRELVSCDLPPYSSRQASVKSWDIGNKFYYYKGKSRKDAIAYDVRVKVLRYDVVVKD